MMKPKRITSLLLATVLLWSACQEIPENVPVASVGLQPPTLSLTEGQSEKLTATVMPDNATDKTVLWSSSDTSVATVDQTGKVTAVKAGTAVITAESGGKKATCSVTVAPATYPVTGIKLEPDKLEGLFDGEERTLTATVLPENATDKRVTWTSSDDKVATVDQNGKVTAVYTGTATITVTTTDGGKQATCEVTVKGRAKELLLDKPSLELAEQETATLTATVLPENAYDKTVTWTSSDAAVATVDQTGKVTAVKAGSATITAANGTLSATCAVTVKSYPIVIYAYNKAGWSPLYLYAWDKNGLSVGNWPGITQTATETINGLPYAKFILPNGIVPGQIGLLFNNGSAQTPDFLAEVVSGVPYYCQVLTSRVEAVDPATFDPSTRGGTEGYSSGNEYGEGSF